MPASKEVRTGSSRVCYAQLIGKGVEADRLSRMSSKVATILADSIPRGSFLVQAYVC